MSYLLDVTLLLILYSFVQVLALLVLGWIFIWRVGGYWGIIIELSFPNRYAIVSNEVCFSFLFFVFFFLEEKNQSIQCMYHLLPMQYSQ